MRIEKSEDVAGEGNSDRDVKPLGRRIDQTLVLVINAANSEVKYDIEFLQISVGVHQSSTVYSIIYT